MKIEIPLLLKMSFYITIMLLVLLFTIPTSLFAQESSAEATPSAESSTTNLLDWSSVQHRIEEVMNEQKKIQLLEKDEFEQDINANYKFIEKGFVTLERINNNQSAKLKQKITFDPNRRYIFKPEEEPTFLIQNTEGLDLEGFVLNNLMNQEGIQIEKIQRGSLTLLKLKKTEKFKPGRFTLKIDALDGQTIEQNFVWGVLAVNTNKTVYAPLETAVIGMAVLDHNGEMVCNAKVDLEIKNPSGGVVTLSTENGDITVLGHCQSKDLIIQADYETNYKVTGTGKYTLALRAQTENGIYSIEDSFEVKDPNPISVERLAATRIYPPLIYPVTIEIKADRDIEGTITELVPEEFELYKVDDHDFEIKESTSGAKMIEKKVNLKKDQSVRFSYMYKAPNISPQFYLNGPLVLYDSEGNEVFKEKRSWQIAADAVANNGTIMYGDAVDTDNMNFRTYTDPTTVGGELTTINTADTNTVVWVRVAASPTREEKIAVHLKATGIMHVLTCTAGCDAAADWTERGTYSTVTTDANAENMRAFDVAYEQLTGRAMIVFSDDNTTGSVYYCLWDGANWTPSTTCGSTFTPGAGNQIDMSGVGVSGQPEWIRLVSRGDRLTGYRSNQMLLGVSDSADDLFLAHWNGESWEDQSNPLDDLSATNALKFNIAWEETTGEGLAVVSDDGVANLRYAEYTAGAWGALQTSGEANNGGQAFSAWVDLANDPMSDDIAIVTADSGSDIELFHWDGSTLSDLDATDDITAEAVTGKMQAVGWTRFSQRAIFLWTDANALTSDMECWGTTGDFTAIVGDIGNPNISNTDDVEDIRLIPAPNNDRMLLLRRDIEAVAGTGDDLLGATYSDSTGCADADWTTLGTLNSDNEGGTLANTIRQAYDAAYTPYSPWSRNWRFFDDETSQNPSVGLNGASENQLPTGVDSEEFFRLRVQITERSAGSQTDTRKKLQYASGCNPNVDETSCTWTDVGDTSETTAVFRYATDAETCNNTNCEDGDSVTVTRLTDSSAGFYVSDKDATTSLTNMDHNAETIVEIDFPLKAEAVSAATTYYFRVYEPRLSSNGQDSPVYRYQEFGQADCLSANCTYPMLRTAPASGITTKFMEPGSDATFGTQFFDGSTGTVTSTNTQANNGVRSLSFDSGAGNTAANVYKSVYADEGNRTSFYLRFEDLPSEAEADIWETSNGTNDIYSLRITSGGKLRTYKNGSTQIGTDSTATLVADTWYRLAIAYTISNASTNQIKVYLDGSEETNLGVTNTGSLNTGTTRAYFGWRDDVPGASRVVYIDDVYVDDGSDLNDPGNIQIAAKIPNAENANNFDSAVGTARSASDYNNINERALSETNGWEHADITSVVENYGIENASSGDEDLTNRTLVARTSWIWATRQSGGCSKSTLFNNGTEFSIALATTVALYTDIINDTSYPTNSAAVGMRSCFDTSDSILYESGMIIAYIVDSTIPLDRLMRHGGNFNNGIEQPFSF